MTRKLVRRLGLLVAVLVLVPVLLTLAAGLLLPRDRLREELTRSLAEATGGQVELGQAGVKFWPHLAVSLDGGILSGRGQDLASGSAGNLESYRLELDRLDVELRLRPLLRREIEVGDVTLKGTLLQVSWEGGEALAHDFHLKVQDLKLPVDAARPEPGALAPGERIPEELALNFDGEVRQLVLQKVSYDQVTIAGDLDALILTVDSLVAGRGGGSLTASGEIDFERDPWGELDFEAAVLAVPAGTLLEPWAPDLAARLAGDLDGEVSGTCNLKDGQTVRSTLSLVGQIGCREGELAAADWLGDVAPYLGRRQDLTNVRFRALDHSFRVDQGQYIIEDLHIDGHDTDWRGSGAVGLDGTMDGYLRVKLPPGFTPELGQWSFLAETLRDADGRVNLSLHLTGPTDNLRVALDLTSLQGGVGQGATDAVKKGLGGLLDKWKTR